jgi:tRNA(fMet)-specific endonuclease VapC
MQYLIDTDWIIEHLRGNAGITNFLEEKFEEGLAISAISLAELYDGVYSSKEPKKHEAALRDFVSGVVVLDLTEVVCKEFGKLRAKLRKKGEPLDNFDLIIASTAKTYNLTILTNNKKHFERIKLRVLSEEYLQ